MDYLTRRHVASAGNHLALLRAARPKFPRLSSLGVRVECGDTVLRREIETALDDIGIRVPLPGDRLAAADVEALLSGHDPQQLKRNIDAFLEELGRPARSRTIVGPPPPIEIVERGSLQQWLDLYASALSDERLAQEILDALVHGDPLQRNVLEFWCRALGGDIRTLPNENESIP